MQIDDDRTEVQKTTHTWFVIGTDRGMSGWGKATGGMSYAAWACRPADGEQVLGWVEGRSDMLRVREAGSGYRPRGVGHCHIYVVEKDHPALS